MSATAVSNAPNVFNPDAPAVQKNLKALRSGWKMRLWQFTKLPSMWFWGGRIKHIDFERCEVRMPYGWASKNPFKSIYFAAQCGAAELSTGTLAILALAGRNNVSMLVSDIRTEFTKKAVADVVFTCEDGGAIIAAVDKAFAEAEPQTVTALSTGRMSDGTVVSRTWLTWTFKVRTS